MGMESATIHGLQNATLRRDSASAREIFSLPSNTPTPIFDTMDDLAAAVERGILRAISKLALWSLISSLIVLIAYGILHAILDKS